MVRFIYKDVSGEEGLELKAGIQEVGHGRRD
jgi:hypothetical protein